MDTEKIQKELDLAAQELDDKGWRDLADKVDYYNEKLQAAKKDSEIRLIGRALDRINTEADRRAAPARAPKKEDRKSKLEALRKRMALRRKKKEAEEKEKKVSPRLARLRRLRKSK